MKIKLLLLFLLLFRSGLILATCTIKYKSHLRGEPSTSSSIVYSLPKFSPLQIIESRDKWFKVKGFKFEGWIFHSLIDQNLDCMTLKETRDPYCAFKNNQSNRPIVYTEGFKVLKKEIGCNLVVDKYGKKLWLSNTNIWPESESMRIIIN